MPTQDDMKEIVACGKDPAYFLKKYAKIQHARKGLIPFETYPFQDECLEAFKDHRYNIVLKSRQLGLSTITAGYAVWLAMFYREKTILVIATKLSTAQEFLKKVKVMLSNIPKHLFLSKYSETKTSVTFDNGSSITAIPTSEDAGRSQALSLLIVDEAHWIRNFEDIWTGLSPTLSTGGSAIILSTPNGVGGQYYKLWIDAVAGQNNFNPINLPWHVHPEHDEEWFRKETKNLSAMKVAQEFLCDFQASGDTFVQTADMEWLYTLIEEPSKTNDIDKNLWIWQKPQPEARYVISGDVSRGNANDYSACHVVDMDTLEVVAEYMGAVPPDRFADIMMKIGHYYNTALLAPENNTFGWLTACRIRDAEYPRLLYQTSKGDIYNYKPTDAEEKPGFSTQAKSRENILTKLEEVIRNKKIRIHSQRTFDQLKTFVWQNNKLTAQRGYNDDLVLSLAIAVWLCVDEPTKQTDAAALDKACLAATHVQRREAQNVIPPVQAMTMPNKQQIQPSQYLKPHDTSRYRGFNPHDYSWLIK